MIQDSFSLQGVLVKLEPLQFHHKDALLAAASDGELWNLWYTSVPSSSTIDGYLSYALEQRAQKRSYPFVVIDSATNSIIGSTRYCRIDDTNRRLEIGYTWYAKSYQRTGVNAECKYLLLQYAFESLDCIAVEFMTNFYNTPSRRAILGIGARQDGILRQHRLNEDGTYRDTVVFSILNTEWHNIKKLLELRLNR